LLEHRTTPDPIRQARAYRLLSAGTTTAVYYLWLGLGLGLGLGLTLTLTLTLTRHDDGRLLRQHPPIEATKALVDACRTYGQRALVGKVPWTSPK